MLDAILLLALFVAPPVLGAWLHTRSTATPGPVHMQYFGFAMGCFCFYAGEGLLVVCTGIRLGDPAVGQLVTIKFPSMVYFIPELIGMMLSLIVVALTNRPANAQS
jgi:hypothetical protein